MLTVTVSNKRAGPLRGLDKSAFTIMDDKTPCEITSFSNDDLPHSVGIVFDMSGSMDASKLSRLAVLSFDDFLNSSNKENEYFIEAFASHPVIVLDWTMDITGVLPRLVTNNNPRRTAIYDALFFGVDKVKTGRYKQRTLILLTDGEDNESAYTFSQVRELLRESDVTLYAIALLHGEDRISPVRDEGSSVLSQLASVTGGRVFYLETKSQVKEVFETLAAEIRYQYRIGIKPVAVAAKPKWHPIKVKVTPPQNAPAEFRSPTIRSREGYYPDRRLR